eukprot:scaffold9393_cov66-Phaeocystis_antarctica.AAC.2
MENTVAQTSASWLSGGLLQRQIVLQAAPSFGRPQPLSRLDRAGHIGLVLTVTLTLTLTLTLSLVLHMEAGQDEDHRARERGVAMHLGLGLGLGLK